MDTADSAPKDSRQPPRWLSTVLLACPLLIALQYFLVPAAVPGETRVASFLERDLSVLPGGVLFHLPRPPKTVHFAVVEEHFSGFQRKMSLMTLRSVVAAFVPAGRPVPGGSDMPMANLEYSLALTGGDLLAWRHRFTDFKTYVREEVETRAESMANDLDERLVVTVVGLLNPGNWRLRDEILSQEVETDIETLWPSGASGFEVVRRPEIVEEGERFITLVRVVQAPEALSDDAVQIAVGQSFVPIGHDIVEFTMTVPLASSARDDAALSGVRERMVAWTREILAARDGSFLMPPLDRSSIRFMASPRTLVRWSGNGVWVLLVFGVLIFVVCLRLFFITPWGTAAAIALPFLLPLAGFCWYPFRLAYGLQVFAATSWFSSFESQLKSISAVYTESFSYGFLGLDMALVLLGLLGLIAARRTA